MDFSTCFISGIVLSLDSMKEMIVSSYQALELSRLLGIKIKEDL